VNGAREPSPRGRERRERLARSSVYVVTDARGSRGDLGHLREFVDAILLAGVDLVQLREKDAEAGDLLRWGGVFREAAASHGALFVVNDRPDVAMALEADGVHLGQGDLPAGFVRKLAGPDLLIGLSTHSDEQREAAPPEADYLCVGPVHATPTKEGRPAIGLDPVRAAAQTETRVWFAIGGIDRRTLPEVVRAGARRIVVVRAVSQATDPAAAVADLRAGLRPLGAPADRGA
jgi:thiamine-phosphate pyrophosphorylase